jgi:O-antigen ligase
MSQYYLKWIARKGENLSWFAISSSLRRQIIRLGFVLTVFAIGVAGVLLNSLYTLRIALGSVGMLALLRYRYVLLLAWVLITPVVSSIPIFTNTNFLTGLTAPTLLLMAWMPVKRTFRRMPALAFLLLFCLWVFAGIVTSPLGIGEFLTTWIIYLDYVALGILTVNVLTTERRVMGLIDAILLAFAYVALYGIYGYFTRQNGATDPEVGFRIFSIFGSSPALGLFLSLGIPLALYRTLTLRGFKRIGGLIVMLVLLVALAMTLARGAFIGVSLSLLIMTFFLPTRKRKLSLLRAVLLLAVLVVLLLQAGNIPIFYRFFQQDTTTLNGRVNLWQILLDRFHPTQLLGHGLDASGILLASLDVNNVRVLHATSYEAHNLYVATLYDQGIIGLTLLALAFISAFVSLIRGLRKMAGPPRLLCLTALAVLISVALQSGGAIDILFQGIGLYFWIILALPFALCWSAPKQLSEANEEALNGGGAMVPHMRARQRTERENGEVPPHHFPVSRTELRSLKRVVSSGDRAAHTSTEV